jgi:hypothetical protein
VTRVGRPALISMCSATVHGVNTVDLLDMRNDTSRARLRVFLAPSWAERLAMRPLDPAVLVAVEALGLSTEIVVVRLARHGGCWRQG